MRKTIRLVIIAALLLSAGSLFAQGTRNWEQSKFEEFEKGSPKGVAIRSDGFLELAPSFRALATTPSTYLWAIASDDRGTVFAAAGAPSRVYRITPEGNVSVLLAPGELQVQALVVDKSGTIYAATSPDGKVYRIDRKGTAKPANAPAGQQPNSAPQTNLDPEYTSSVYFEPKTKYIWALALDNDGRLYVATGDRGEIFRVNRDGTSSVFFKSDDAHIRAITFDPKGNLIAGSDGSGLIYRISPNGEGFVLYSAPKKEITALAIDNNGNIYAAAAGDKRSGATVTSPVVLTPQPTPMPPTGTQPATQTMPPPQIPVPGLGASGSEIYRIAPDGSPKRLWTSRDDLVYSLAFGQDGRLIAGTGNKGKVYGIGAEGQFSDMLKASANQVIGFARAPKGDLYAATSNLGKLFVIEDSAEREGSFESDVFDARIFSRWGRAEVRAHGNVELFARSGNVDNPDRNWSTWKKVDLQKDPVLDIPPARYMQWRAVLHSGNPSPQLDSVNVNYLAKNVAPEIDDITVQVGSRFPSSPRTVSEAANSSTVAGAAPATPTSIRDRDSVAVSWRTHDENEDQLSFAVYYRGDGETRWKLLKDNIADRFYSFESGLLPDGGYTIRIIATDAPSHSPDDALTATRDSTRFEVDNTPPAVTNLAAVLDGDNLHITFTSSDSFSPIRRAEFSIDAGTWQFVGPVGGLSDSKTENYDLTVPITRSNSLETPAAELDNRQAPAPKKSKPAANPAAEEHVVVVRCYDRFENMGSAKVVVRPR